MARRTLHDMVEDKATALAAFKKSHGNVSAACIGAGISRVTFYNWYNNDTDFKAKADEIKEERKDFIESALDKRIAAGDTAAIIFAAKTICKDRGYTEKNETEVSVSAAQPLSITFKEVVAKPKE